MKKKIMPLVLLVTFLITGRTTGVAQALHPNVQLTGSSNIALERELNQGRLSFEEINEQLSRLEPYVKYTQGSVFQAFNSKAALRDGFSKDVVLLAQEIVDHQNELVRAIENKKIEDLEQLRLKIEKYPRLKRHLELATEYAIQTGETKSWESLRQNPPACGNWSYPVPNYTPTRYIYYSSDPEHTFSIWGFHHTAWYVPGSNEFDYTEGRGYDGPYGYCSGPRFRNHGIVEGSTRFSVQWGEPNPEILGYVWPYWNWGVYVEWWHDNY